MLLNNLNTGLLDSIPGVFCIKDTESNYLIGNQEHCDVIGYKKYEHFIDAGAKDFNLNCSINKMADIFISQDKKVIKEKKPLKILGYYKMANDQNILYLGEKKPIFDESGNITAISCHYQNVTDIDVINTFTMIKNNSFHHKSMVNTCYYPIQSWNQFNLSPRQTECLYFLTRGFSILDIAGQLQLSRRTVEDYVNEIKAKMLCYSKKEVIDKAIHHGFLNYIPF